MVMRLHMKSHSKYPTKSNKFVVKHIPGGKLVMQKINKKVSGPRTPKYLGHKRLQGVKAMRPVDSTSAAKRTKSVTRAYGGVLTHAQVRDRVVRAFLIEEMKIVKRVTQRRRN